MTKRKKARVYSEVFKLQVLTDYYSHGDTLSSLGANGRWTQLVYPSGPSVGRLTQNPYLCPQTSFPPTVWNIRIQN